jgi:hypothetical protein
MNTFLCVHRGCNIVPDSLTRATDLTSSFMFMYVLSYICEMMYCGVQCNLLMIFSLFMGLGCGVILTYEQRFRIKTIYGSLKEWLYPTSFISW